MTGLGEQGYLLGHCDRKGVRSRRWGCGCWWSWRDCLVLDGSGPWPSQGCATMREPQRGWISHRGPRAGALEGEVLPDRTLQGTQDKVLSSLSVENTASEEWLCCA